jgi:YbgC/YbaW family acyl-CoA thioester hydrolase
MPECHRHPVKVRFYELDPYGHLNHSVYVQLFETGRIELLDSVGLGLQDLEDQGYRVIVSRIETRFLKPAVGGDLLVIETEVIENRRASSRWGQRIMRGDEALATQEVLAAVTDTAGKLVRSPAFIGEALAPYAIDPEGSI